MKDSVTTDLEEQIRNLQREISSNNTSALPIQPIESSVSKVEYEKLDQELHSTRKRLDGLVSEVKLDERKN